MNIIIQISHITGKNIFKDYYILLFQILKYPVLAFNVIEKHHMSSIIFTLILGIIKLTFICELTHLLAFYWVFTDWVSTKHNREGKAKTHHSRRTCAKYNV